MQKLTIDWVKSNGLLVFEGITGSRAYGLDTATSDTDIRGVFVLPKDTFYGMDYTTQVANETNDTVYYELGRFMELLAKNNPNIMEMLNLPAHCILHKDAMMATLEPALFLSKLCEQTFANYAFTQIKKAYGLEKKILNPVNEKRKSVLDFCFVYKEKEALALPIFLQENNWLQENIGLASIAHLKDCYNLYYSKEGIYAGVVRKEEANEVSLSSMPKGAQPQAVLYFNREAYSSYCKKYKAYWEWVNKRNEERYKTTMAHGKNYDSKNMMHVFRLLLMAKEIATEGTVNVFRKDRDFLLGIKQGKYEYDELVEQAEALKNELPLRYQNSTLQDAPNVNEINNLLVGMRKHYYR